MRGSDKTVELVVFGLLAVAMVGAVVGRRAFVDRMFPISSGCSVGSSDEGRRGGPCVVTNGRGVHASADLDFSTAGARDVERGRGSSITPPPVPHRAPSPVLFKTVATAAGRHGVPVHVLAGLVDDESSWRPRARGKHGERGLLQLKSATARWCGGRVDRYNAAQNADCGARYLRAQFDRFGTWQMAIVAFKAGPEAIPDAIPVTSWAFAQRALQKAEAYR